MSSLREVLSQDPEPTVAVLREATYSDLRYLQNDRRVSFVEDIAAVDAESEARLRVNPREQVLVSNAVTHGARPNQREIDADCFAISSPWGRMFELYNVADHLDPAVLDLYEEHALAPRMCVLPYRIQIYGRELAFLSRDFDDNRAGAFRIEHPGLVADLRSLFLHCWAQSTPLLSARPGSDALEVVLALASGVTDEVGAVRMGVSLRTYRRRIEQLMRQLGAQSRFAAGAAAARQGLLDLASAVDSGGRVVATSA